jgi:hypothetical protein
VKRSFAIVFSLLLIAAQTFAVPGPVSSTGTIADTGCCCDDCRCCVGESRTPAAPPVEATVPAAAQNQFVLPPATDAILTLAAPVNESSPASVHPEFRAATPPLFQRNCALLI